MAIYVSVVIVNRNSETLLARLLANIRSQDYPQESIEILIIDGGSTDQSARVASKYGAVWVDAGFADNQEARRAIGIINARGSIVVSLDTDNLPPTKDWFRRVLEPFRNHEKVGFAFTRWYEKSPENSLLENYFALIGGNDVVAWALRKNDRVEWGSNKLPSGVLVVEQTERYQVVGFTQDIFPTLGCNGFAIRRELISATAHSSPESFLHIDSVVDLLRAKPSICGAIIDIGLIHGSNRTLWTSLRARITYLKNYRKSRENRRSYLVFDSKNPKDVLRLSIFVLSSITVLFPVALSIMRVLRTRDITWLIHPLVCLGYVFGYGLATLRAVKLR